MSESSVHLLGVAALERFVRERAGQRADLVVYRDTPDAAAQTKPPLVGGFRPDIFARTWKDGAFFIGEAKTPRDLESSRSLAQLKAFIDAVRIDPLGSFVLSVPYGVSALAIGVLKMLARGESDLLRRVHCIAPRFEQTLFAEVY